MQKDIIKTERQLIQTHLTDSTDGFSKTWAKNDQTPNVKVLIKKCKFNNVIVAIGTHRYSDNGGIVYHKNITIEDCNIKKAKSYGINCLAWANCNIRNNKINSYDESIRQRETKNIKIKNN